MLKARRNEALNGHAAVRIFAANERMNQMLIAGLDPAAWQARPEGKVRTIAAIFTHVHNIRRKWVRLSAPHVGVPAQLNRRDCTMQQAAAALAESAARCEAMLAEALDDSGNMNSFHRDGWAPAWPVGIEMLCYMVAHEAHHRGQVCLLAHQLGSALGKEVADSIWNWEKIWRQGGARGLPGSGR